MNIRKLIKIFQNTHTHTNNNKNCKVNLYNIYINTDTGLFNFLKSTEKETVLLLG